MNLKVTRMQTLSHLVGGERLRRMLTGVLVDVLWDPLIDLVCNVRSFSIRKIGVCILAKSCPGCETLTEEWTIVLVLVHGFHAIKDGIVDLSVVFALKLNCRWSSSGPLVQNIPILVVNVFRFTQLRTEMKPQTAVPTSATNGFGTEP